MDSSFEEGKYYCIEFEDEWNAICPKRGWIMEVTNPYIHGIADCSGEAAFLVRDVRVGERMSMVVEVKSLGSDNPEVSKFLSANFNRKVGTLHMCTEGECYLEPEAAVHIQNVVLWQPENFNRSYVTPAMQRQIKKWLDGADNLTEEGESGKEKETGAAPPMPGEFPKKAPRAGVLRNPGKDGKAEEKSDLKPGSTEDLRKRLGAVRSRLQQEGGVVAPAGKVSVPRARQLESEALLVTSSPEPSPSVLDESEHQRLLRKKARKEKRKAAKQNKELEEKSKETLRLSSGSLSQAAIQDIKGGTSSTLQKQLAIRAKNVSVNKEKELETERKRKRDKDPGKRLVKILVDGLTGKKKKKDKDGERKRRKVKKEGDPYDPGDPGDSSDSSDSGGSPLEESSSEKEKDLEPPLRRKSRKHPGSVLELLVKHASEKLDQTGKVATGEDGAEAVTGGIKIASYFNICVRPQIVGNLNQQREMHHLTNAIDLLRLGELGRLGDLLASRFMSIHQSLIDGNWASARFMEMMPMEEMSAAGPQIVLDARKHAKMNAKLVNPDPTHSWKGGGKGKGKTSWSSASQDWQTDTKGKGKKGGKGKGKHKPWWNTSGNQETDPAAGKKKDNAADR